MALQDLSGKKQTAMFRDEGIFEGMVGQLGDARAKLQTPECRPHLRQTRAPSSGPSALWSALLGGLRGVRAGFSVCREAAVLVMPALPTSELWLCVWSGVLPLWSLAATDLAVARCGLSEVPRADKPRCSSRRVDGFPSLYVRCGTSTGSTNRLNGLRRPDSRAGESGAAAVSCAF